MGDFKQRGKTSVCTPEDTFRCFMGSEIDVLVAENRFLRKEDQDRTLRRDCRGAFELD